MSKKYFPLSIDKLHEVIQKFPTPFHIYEEKAIRENIRALKAAFSWAPAFHEQFAVKALPNPRIVQILHEEGAGTDCSSLAELLISEAAGLKGEEIPLSARIMAVADVFDALVSKRCYKPGFGFEKSMEIIREESGTHFDPLVAGAFLNAADEVRKVLEDREREHENEEEGKKS